MLRIRSLGVLSCARIFGIIHAVLGIVVAIFFLFIGMAGLMFSHGEREKIGGMVGIVVLAALMPVFYGVAGFVTGALGAWIYNLAANAIGGIEAELEAVPAPAVAVSPPPPAPAG